MNYKVKDFNFDKGKTIGERMDSFLNKQSKADDIVAFLSIESAHFLSQGDFEIEKMSQTKRQEFVDFYEKFEKYDKKSYQARMENWGGNEPLIIRVAQAIVDFEYYEDIKRQLSKVDKFVLKEAQELCDKIMRIRKDKLIIVIYKNDSSSFEIPRTIPKEYLDDVKLELLFLCTDLILADANMFIEVKTKKNEYTIYGAGSFFQTSWYPISIDILEGIQGIDSSLYPKGNLTFDLLEKDNDYSKKKELLN